MFQKFITIIEQQSFGVSTYLADKFNMSTARVRLFFIYSSFLAVGFPILFYLLAALVLDIRRYMKRMRLLKWE